MAGSGSRQRHEQHTGEVCRVAWNATPVAYNILTSDPTGEGRACRKISIATAGRLIATGMDDVVVPLPSGLLGEQCEFKALKATHITSVTQSGSGPAITVSGTPAGEYNTLRVKISAGGVNGVATFDWSTDGGSTWGATGVTVPTTPFTAVLGATGLTLTFADSTWVLNETYDWNTYISTAQGVVVVW